MPYKPHPLTLMYPQPRKILLLFFEVLKTIIMFYIPHPSDMSATGSKFPTNFKRTLKQSNSSEKNVLPSIGLRVPSTWKKTTAGTFKGLKQSVQQPLAPHQRGRDASLKTETYLIRRATLTPDFVHRDEIDFYSNHPHYGGDKYLLEYNDSNSRGSTGPGYSSMSAMTYSGSDDEEDSEDDELSISPCDILPHTELVFIKDQYKKLSDSSFTSQGAEIGPFVEPIVHKTGYPTTITQEARHDGPTHMYSLIPTENSYLEEELILAKSPASMDSSKTKTGTDKSASPTTPPGTNDELFLSFFDRAKREPPAWLKRKVPVTFMDHIIYLTLNIIGCILFLPICISFLSVMLLLGPAIEQLGVVHRNRGSDWSVMRDIAKLLGICFFVSIPTLYLAIFYLS